MAKWQFTKGLHDLGNNCYAWLQPDGTWGHANSGLIADQGETLLIDTLMDLAHTREMLAGYRGAVPAAKTIGTLVNTHAHGDHTYGNQLVAGARILASRASADEMSMWGAAERAKIMRDWRSHGEVGAFLQEIFGGRFDFEGIVGTPPTETFERELTLNVGAKEVRLTNVGPAHTRGDVMVHVPNDRTVFTGDIMFVNGHPVIFSGPVSNWLKACDLILSWDVETVVPGHGPITDKEGVRVFRQYLEYLYNETRQRFDAGMSEDEAVRDISLDPYRDWIDDERIVVNVNTLYHEFRGDTSPRNIMALYGRMGRYRKERAARA